MPGLVNAHTHVPMTLLRGLADDLRLDVWLLGYMMPVEREFVSPEFVTAGHAAGLRRDDPLRRDLLRRHVLLRGRGGAGHGRGRAARPSAARPCSSSPRRTPESYEDSLASAREFIQALEGPPADRACRSRPTPPTPAPPRSSRPAPRWRLEFDVPLHTHLAETPLEVENSAQRERHAGGPLGQEAGPASTPRCWPPTASTSTRARCGPCSTPAPASRTTRPRT